MKYIYALKFKSPFLVVHIVLFPFGRSRDGLHKIKGFACVYTANKRENQDSHPVLSTSFQIQFCLPWVSNANCVAGQLGPSRSLINIYLVKMIGNIF